MEGMVRTTAVTVFLVIVVASLCGAIENQEKWTSYANGRFGFSVQYPTSWGVERSANQDGAFIFSPGNRQISIGVSGAHNSLGQSLEEWIRGKAGLARRISLGQASGYRLDRDNGIEIIVLRGLGVSATVYTFLFQAPAQQFAMVSPLFERSVRSLALTEGWDVASPAKMQSFTSTGTVAKPSVSKSPLQLFADLESPNGDVRIQAAREIGSLARRDPRIATRAVPALLQTLQNLDVNLGTYESVSAIAGALAEFGNGAAQAVPLLCRITTASYEGRLRDASIAASRALGRIGTSQGISCLADAVRNQAEHDVVIGAARALAELGPAAAKAIPALSYRKTNPNSYWAEAVSGACADALRRIRGF